MNDLLETVDPNEDSPAPDQPEDETPGQSTEVAPLERTLFLDGADTADQGIESLEPPKKPRIFISHKRDVAINDEIAARLKKDLEPYCEDIYLDLDMLAGDEYVRIIEEELSNADILIVLISETANRSAWIKTELSYANFYRKQKGSPRILPVRLGFEGLYDPIVDRYIGQIQAVSFDPINDDYEKRLLEPLTLSITSKRKDRERPEDRLAGFVVHESRRKRLQTAFVEPPTLAGVRAELRDRRLLWITGDAGVRNFLGISLAIDEGRERVYEISKPRSWTEINSSVVSNAAIIFQDFNPAMHFDETTPKAEFDSLRSLIKRENTVIVTMSEEAFREVDQEIRKEEFEYDARKEVDLNTYGHEAKLRIFRELLELSYQTDTLSSKQYEWAQRILSEPPPTHSGLRQKSKLESHDKFLEIIQKCTPADIERFFTLHLSEIEKPSDFVKLLQRSAGGDEEIHSWFISLDDSTRCFVMTLALCSELDRPELWAKYKTIVQELKRLDPHLSLLPLGICRQRAMPYVSIEGPVDFVDTRVANSVNDELARSYREYLVELLPQMKEWSVPSGRGPRTVDGTGDERKRKANESQAFRASIARLIGKAGKEDIDDLSEILEYWATDPILKIREAVAIALEQTVPDSKAANSALDLLKKWGSGFANDERAFLKLYATASPLTRFTSPSSGQAVYLRALSYLKSLTKDTRGGVRFYTSIAIKKMARKVRLSDLETLLDSLAQDENLSTRVNAAHALNEARFGNEEEASDLLNRWLGSTNENLRWVAICSLLGSGNQSRGNSSEETQPQILQIQALLVQGADAVASVLLEMISDDRLNKNVWPIFSQLLMETSTNSREALIAGLGKSDFKRLDKKLLERLRRFGDPQHERLIVEIRRAYWERLLSGSSNFLADMRKRLGEEQRVVELFQTLTDMLEPGPQGARDAMVSALIAFYPQDREILEEVLLKLRKMAPSIFEPVSTEIRRAALRSLFYDPPTFVQILIADLENSEVSRESYSAVESLAQPEPLGQRKELLQALAYAYAVNPATVRPLLKLLRIAESSVLPLLSFEFRYTLLEGKLDNPGEFVAAVLDAMQDEPEQHEVLNVLERLAMPEPNGKKRSLISSLAIAKTLDNASVDRLLQHQLLKSRTGLARLEFEVRVASVLDSIFVPKFVSRWFTPR